MKPSDEYFCCNGTVVDIQTMGCCAGVAYNLSTQGCCGGYYPYDLGSSTEGCCNGWPYYSPAKCCHNQSMYVPGEGYHCCSDGGLFPYDTKCPS